MISAKALALYIDLTTRGLVAQENDIYVLTSEGERQAQRFWAKTSNKNKVLVGLLLIKIMRDSGQIP